MKAPFSLIHSRRKFIASTLTATGGIALLGSKPSFAGIKPFKPAEQYTVQEIIDLILKKGNLMPIPGTVDTIKSGSGDTVVTGIVTTMFATITVIKAAAKLGANFIIAHEPTFYNHTDNKDFVKDNPLVKQKLELLDKYKITVWRCHDYIHTIKPDVIGYGFLKKAGWLSYYKAGGYTLTMPPMTLDAMVKHLKKTLDIAHLRIIGDLNQSCGRVTLIPGAAGGKMQMSLVMADNSDVLIVGEVAEWETAEFIRDSNLLGRKTALIILGHQKSEEPGMEYFVEWLQPLVPKLKIMHIASGDPFLWM